jgi:hypothetical protein
MGDVLEALIEESFFAGFQAEGENLSASNVF